jgi:hypothetical protein
VSSESLSKGIGAGSKGDGSYASIAGSGLAIGCGCDRRRGGPRRLRRGDDELTELNV